MCLVSYALIMYVFGMYACMYVCMYVAPARRAPWVTIPRPSAGCTLTRAAQSAVDASSANTYPVHARPPL